MPIGDAALVTVAGMVCGILNSIAGGGSLVLFPALVLTGLDPLTANVTNSVTAWIGFLGGVAGFRHDLGGTRARTTPLVYATLAGSTVGCVLLLATPSDAFDVVVPVLVLVATLLTGLQPRVRRWAATHRPDAAGVGAAAIVSMFVATIYGGYFGGALGVIILGVLGVTVRESMRSLNATKTVLALVDSSVSVVVFGLFGPVQWAFVGVAAPSTLVGGVLGAVVARRLDETTLRRSVVVLGLTATIYLAVHAL